MGASAAVVRRSQQPAGPALAGGGGNLTAALVGVFIYRTMGASPVRCAGRRARHWR